MRKHFLGVREVCVCVCVGGGGGGGGPKRILGKQSFLTDYNEGL